MRTHFRLMHTRILSTGGKFVSRSIQPIKMNGYHNIGDMRKSYRDNKDAFTEDQLVSQTDPFAQFADWFEKIKGIPEILEPNAMCLATSNKDGQPSARFVLLKGFGKDVGGFTFFTNYNSRKGSDLEQNSKAALTFYWDKLNRQIRIEGTVTKVPEPENDVYFQRRPLASQIGAAASAQSTIIASRDVLIEKAEEISKNCNGRVEKPKHWGGYLLVPYFFEFWQGQSDRLHDRICFKRDNDTDPWKLFRLAP
uniref:pyridoxal 5'-phosphate synthase n=1 Tax=Lygus hesperus TaxID=30085 RepID=A0A0A9YHC3_LYGHE